ncbi:MAG: GNAT family N-acetyltransferase [Sphingopyxis sp.]|nr:GNAT family N-acetyltransferase [Sphingopyxis sp.]
MAQPVIETARLRLREHRLSDKDDHVAMWADERVTRFIGGEPRDETLSWSKFLAAAGLWPIMGFGYWVFADKVSDRLVGMGGLSYFARGIVELEGVPEAGWAFDADHWGQGLATEAMTAVLAWADAHLGAPEVRCIINPGNDASEKVAAKLGFALSGSSDALGDPVNLWARPRT